MGGCSYDRDVYSSGSSYSSSGFHSSSLSDATFTVSSVSELDESLLPIHRTLQCNAKTGLIIALDVTGSMGDSAKLLYDKLPMLWGQIEQQGYLDDFAISFAAVGDCNSDRAPFQVCDFAQGLEIDEGISKFYLEGNGGGQRRESYEMLAYFYAHNTRFTHPKAEKPFFIMIGDEAPYPEVSADDVERHFGEKLQSDIPSTKVFAELQKKFHFKHLHVPYGGGGRSSEDSEIGREWRKCIGEDYIQVSEPKSVVDVILGIIAILKKARTLDQYQDDMRDREQTDSRIKNVTKSLETVMFGDDGAPTKSKKLKDGDSKAGQDVGVRL